MSRVALEMKLMGEDDRLVVLDGPPPTATYYVLNQLESQDDVIQNYLSQKHPNNKVHIFFTQPVIPLEHEKGAPLRPVIPLVPKKADLSSELDHMSLD
jgi:hypothetical protein